MEAFNCVVDMTSAELVRWLFVFARMAGIEKRLAEMTQNSPDTALVAAQNAIKAELTKRAQAKGIQP
jgi:hypothetical protein